MNAIEQNRRFPASILRISGEPRDDVIEAAAAPGIQGAVGFLLGRAYFPLPRATGTGALAAVLSERGDTEDVGHKRHENRGCLGFTSSSARFATCAWELFFAPKLRIIFSKNRKGLAQKDSLQRAPRGRRHGRSRRYRPAAKNAHQQPLRRQ